MFGKFFKAKGKLYLCSLFALCAVLLCCATFAFAGLFGGGVNDNIDSNSQTNNSLTANAAATINKSGNVWTVTASS